MEQMNAEDEYLAELIRRDNEISYFKQALEKEIELSKEKDKVLSEKDKALSEKDKIIIAFAKTLKENGKSPEEIQKMTNLSKDEMNKL